MAVLRCWWRTVHNPVRHPLGGFKCADCGLAGADLDAMGFTDSTVSTRTTYDRGARSITRTPWVRNSGEERSDQT